MVQGYFNRLSTSVLLGYYAVKILSNPILKLFEKFYQAIKDEHYLTGRRLQNAMTGAM